MSLSDLALNSNAAVAKAAQSVARYKQQLEAKQISPAEYADLCKDATAITNIDADAATVEERVLAQAALNEILQIAMAAIPIP